MNFDRKQAEEHLYNQVPLNKDYQYQMELLKKQLQMILDDERGPGDLDKKIAILEKQNKVLQLKNQFLLQTLKEHSILTLD
tara:strand:- start:7507 stop:7749 length:243 start_codon:yes stop_codon:yes gene_type:complete